MTSPQKTWHVSHWKVRQARYHHKKHNSPSKIVTCVMLQGTYVSGTVYIYFCQNQCQWWSGNRMSAFCQYFPVLPLFSVNKDIILPAAFYRHHFVGSNLSPVFSITILPAFFLPFSAVICQQHIVSTMLPAVFLRQNYISIINILTAFCKYLFARLFPAEFCLQHFARILAA